MKFGKHRLSCLFALIVARPFQAGGQALIGQQLLLNLVSNQSLDLFLSPRFGRCSKEQEPPAWTSARTKAARYTLGGACTISPHTGRGARGTRLPGAGPGA